MGLESREFLESTIAEKVTRLLGTPLASASPVTRGYTSAGRWLIETRSGLRAFAKIGITEQTSKWLLDEIAVYQKFRSNLMPRVLAFSDKTDQPVLLLEDLAITIGRLLGAKVTFKSSWVQSPICILVALICGRFQLYFQKDCPVGKM